MDEISLTATEFAILGLLVEGASHGYELERRIEERGMRDWTEIGFSSIYFVLGKLEKKRCVTAGPNGGKAKKTFSVTPQGVSTHQRHTFNTIAAPHPLYPSILLGLANWPVLDADQARKALTLRLTALRTSLDQAKKRQLQQAPMPDFVEAMFEYSISQMKAEISWVENMIDTQGEKDEQS